MSRRVRIIAALTVVGVVAAGAAAITGTGHAAGTSVASAKLSVFRPSELPPVCTPHSQTVAAAADTYINQLQSTTNYGTAGTLNVNGRANRANRTFVRFTLPTAPAGCTLGGATLRLFNTSATAGRTLDVYRSTISWTETGLTWSTTGATGTAGTAVGTTSAAGWQQWTVTTHVQSLYSGTNTGFVVRDSNETQSSQTPQVFASREAASDQPQLVLQWQ